MLDIEAIADQADAIINGYAFTQDDERTRVFNLNRPTSAAVLGPSSQAGCVRRKNSNSFK